MSEAKRIIAALQDRWFGRYGLACCPAHGDRNPNLTQTDGRDRLLLAHCKAGCTFAAALDDLSSLWLVEWQRSVPQTDSAKLTRCQTEMKHGAEKRERQLRPIWEEAQGSIALLAAAGRNGLIFEIRPDQESARTNIVQEVRADMRILLCSVKAPRQ